MRASKLCDRIAMHTAGTQDCGKFAVKSLLYKFAVQIGCAKPPQIFTTELDWENV